MLYRVIENEVDTLKIERVRTHQIQQDFCPGADSQQFSHSLLTSNNFFRIMLHSHTITEHINSRIAFIRGLILKPTFYIPNNTRRGVRFKTFS